MPRQRKYPVYAKGECPETFASALGHSYHSTSVLCEACNRVHFTHELDQIEPGEYERLCKLEQDDPDGYIGHSDYVQWGTFDGVQVVILCPCGRAASIAKMLWDNRYVIADFLKEEAARRASNASEDERLMSATAVAVEA